MILKTILFIMTSYLYLVFTRTGRDRVFIYEADSGAFINEVDVEGHITCLHLSETDNKFWAGNTDGYVSIWDIDRGINHWKKKVLKVC